MKIRKIIYKTLIVGGLLLATTSMYTTYKVENNNKNLVKEYKEVMKNTEEKLELPQSVLGILKIPKLNLEVAVKEGTDDETLKYAVGHFEETPMAGEVGNFSIAGHRAYTYNKFFSNLDEVIVGDEIEFYTEKETYKYKIINTKVIEPTQLEVLNSIDNKETITLITCTPKFVGSHRLIVVGERI